MEQRKSIGVDVSKKTLDLAIYAGEFDFSLHLKVSNDSEGFDEIEAWMSEHDMSANDTVFTMEFTGLYAQSLRQWLESKDIPYFMVNPKKMHDFSVPVNFKGLGRSKTDFLDSFKIAYYGFSNCHELRPSKLPLPAILKLKRLLAERRQYVAQACAYKQQRHDIACFESSSSQIRKKSMLADFKSMINKVDDEIDNVISSDATLRTNYDLLTSVIAIGRVVATETLVLTNNFTSITNPRVYAHYLGVAPDKKQSGTSVCSPDKTDCVGFRQEKADLSMVALAAIKLDPQIKAYWKRRKKEGKHGGIVLNAIKFKLILRMFAVVKKQRPFVKLDF
jgi:transposase